MAYGAEREQENHLNSDCGESWRLLSRHNLEEVSCTSVLHVRCDERETSLEIKVRQTGTLGSANEIALKYVRTCHGSRLNQ